MDGYKGQFRFEPFTLRRHTVALSGGVPVRSAIPGALRMDEHNAPGPAGSKGTKPPRRVNR